MSLYSTLLNAENEILDGDWLKDKKKITNESKSLLLWIFLPLFPQTRHSKHL